MAKKNYKSRKNRKGGKKYSVKERKAYWIGFGQGLSYPSAKSASYGDSLSERESRSRLNGFKKSNAIPAADYTAFKRKRY